MTANQEQVGGTHYKTEYEHWDFCEDYNLGCMEYAATKHITRHRTKNGIQDVAKARHYVQKLIELHRKDRRLAKGRAPGDAIEFYAEANSLGTLEKDFIYAMAQWGQVGDLEGAIDILRKIESQYAGG